MIIYILGIVLVCIGFLMPPYGGYEYIFTLFGGYLFFKKLKEDNFIEKK